MAKESHLERLLSIIAAGLLKRLGVVSMSSKNFHEQCIVHSEHFHQSIFIVIMPQSASQNNKTNSERYLIAVAQSD
jgi:hypothetical protein